MANNVDLVLRLLAEDKASAAFKKVGSEVDATGSKYGKFAKRAATALAAVGVVKFAKDSVKAYAEAEQSQAKLEQAYRKFPKTANLSIEALREYNSELQTKTKYDDDDTAAMQAHLAMFNLTGQQIKTLTPLVQDLASAQGIDLASAGDAVGKALMGNAKALKAIGVNFKATGDSAKDYAAIQQILNQQVGGFAENEGKTAAGQAAILANQFGDLQESVGAALVPALQSMVNVLTPITKAFNGLPQPVKTTAIVVGAAGAAFLYLTPKILAARAAVTQFGISSRVSGTHVKGFGKAVGVMTVALTAASIANNTMSESTTNVDDALSLLAGNHATDQIGTDLAHLFGATTKMDDAAAAIAGVDSSLAEMVNGGNLTGAYAKFNQLRDTFQGMGGDVALFDEKFSEYRSALDKAATPTKNMAGSIKNVGGAALDASGNVKSLSEEIDDLRGTQMDAEEATSNLEDAIDAATASVKENGKNLSLNTEAGRNNRAALRDIASAALNGVEAWTKNGASAATVAAKTKEARNAFIATAVKMGATATEAANLADAYGLIPTKVSTTVAAPGATSVLNTINAINTAIRKMPGHVGISVGVGGDVSVGHGTGGHAAGGYMRAGQVSRVGEFGPELFVAPRAGRIVPASSTAAMSGGDTVIHTHVHIQDREVGASLVRLKRSNGGTLPFI